MTAREEALALFQKARKLDIADGHKGYVQCLYCRRWIPVEQSVAVHYIPRQYRALEMEPNNVWAGCSSCNGLDQLQSNAGEAHDRYREWLIETQGEWVVLWLENRKRVTVKHGMRYYKEKIQELREWLKKRS
jgi:hypothetical protein